MNSAEVLRVLRITRQTLTKYVKNGTIKVSKLPNGRYEYDETSVYKFLNKDVSRKTYIYARVSTSKQKPDL
ncbi:MAG: IS607 family transposase, partial [Oscillospiraceae bacterium]|nr:IS607 family transposase [Oscillospiraceae bacterium]MDD6082680.1 IS607 family transposase [Oscillospiraceae bacterium]